MADLDNQQKSQDSEENGWFFIWTVNIVLVFTLVLMAGRFGDIRLGGPTTAAAAGC